MKDGHRILDESSCRNLIKKPLVLYWVLSRNPSIFGIQNRRFLNQVPAVLMWTLCFEMRFKQGPESDREVGLPRPLSVPREDFAGVVADGTSDSLAGREML